MSVPWILVLAGGFVFVTATGAKALFVNRSDVDNPSRRVVNTLRIAGLVAAVWGVVLLFAYGTAPGT